jgi:YidC/Oxa1 family membrane protein insertase
VAKDSDSIELVKVHEGMPAPLSFTFPGSSLDLPLASAFEASVSALDLAKEPDKRQLIFSQTFPGRLKIEKTYVFHPDRFAFDLEVRAVNLSQEPLSQSAALTWHEYVDPNAETDSYTHEGPVVYVKKDVERPEVKKMEAQATLGPDVAWGGFETKYFIAAMVPQNPSLSSILLEKDGTRNMVSVGMRGAKTVIPPGRPGCFNTPCFWPQRLFPVEGPGCTIGRGHRFRFMDEVACHASAAGTEIF